MELLRLALPGFPLGMGLPHQAAQNITHLCISNIHQYLRTTLPIHPSDTPTRL